MRTLYYGLFRFQLRLRCWLADRIQAQDASGLPLPPALLRYRVSELLGREDFLTIGAGCARLIEEHSRSMGVDLAQCRRILDFGCGCGRTLRWLLRAFPEVEFYGADVDQEAIDWCSRKLPSDHFIRNGPLPPLPYPDRHFDAIYCLSVFTHLDEPAQDMWFTELRRLLAPDGVLLISVHGEGATKALDPDGLATLQTAGFVHRRSQKLKGILPDWYQTSWHSEHYIVERLSSSFEQVSYHDVPGSSQAIVMARGRTHLV
jgi:SAM-dependent methyltransferase